MRLLEGASNNTLADVDAQSAATRGHLEQNVNADTWSSLTKNITTSFSLFVSAQLRISSVTKQ